MQALLEVVDSSFKYIFLGFNFLTLLVVYLYQRGRRVTRQHNILFVTAHPDDESMFFGPTITALTREYFVHLLCLSSNEQRALELSRVVEYLGIHQFKCVANDRLLDGEKEKWCEETILSEVKAYVKQNNIRAIFTFDEWGVSGHPNHRAIYSALADCEREEVKAQVANQTNSSQLAQGEKQKTEPPKLLKIYYLQSTNLLRKYSGMIEIVIALVRQFSWVRVNCAGAWQAMRLHRSQFMWYRKLWVVFSRFTYVNTYRMRRVSLE